MDVPVKVKTPTILQTEATECGAACLAIVLGYFRHWAPLNEIRLACGVSRDGSRAANILKAGKQYGLEIKAFRADPRDLRCFRPPMILHWNFNHFVVLEGIEKGKVYVNDPACGRCTVDEKELNESFTGVVLVCQPSPSFAAGGRPPSFVKAMARRFPGSFPPIAFVVLCGLLLMLPRLAAPFFSKIFVQDVLIGQNFVWLHPLLLWMAVLAALAGALTWLQQMALNRLEIWFTLKESSRLFWHILRLPVEFFSRRFIGDLTSRLTLTSRVAEVLSRDLAINFLNVTMVLLFGALMLRYNAILTGVCLGCVLLDVAALHVVARNRIDDNRRLLLEDGRLHSSILAGLDVIESVKAAGAESDLIARWTGYHAKIVNIEQQLERRSVWLEAVPPLLAALNTVAVLAIGSLQVFQGKLSLGGLVGFNLLAATFLAPVARLVGLGGKLQIVAGDLNRLEDVFSYPVELDAQTAACGPAPDTDKLSGLVELHNVSFGYSRLERPLIQAFNLRIRPGGRVALVGPSGSGKSTVAQLIAGLLDPWHGDVCFDKQARRELPRPVLTASIGVVNQTVTLFEGSVRDNLTLWETAISMEAIVSAAQDAAIHDDILARPGAYDSMVEEGGRNWSGGQCQRLDLARALVRCPSILILDEATSALDPLLESTIYERLRRRGCTCLVVAHRLSTIRDADEILVLDNGKVIQRGTHQELIRREGLYYDLASVL